MTIKTSSIYPRTEISAYRRHQIDEETLNAIYETSPEFVTIAGFNHYGDNDQIAHHFQYNHASFLPSGVCSADPRNGTEHGVFFLSNSVEKTKVIDIITCNAQLNVLRLGNTTLQVISAYTPPSNAKTHRAQLSAIAAQTYDLPTVFMGAYTHAKPLRSTGRKDRLQKELFRATARHPYVRSTRLSELLIGISLNTAMNPYFSSIKTDNEAVKGWYIPRGRHAPARVAGFIKTYAHDISVNNHKLYTEVKYLPHKPTYANIHLS